MGPTDAELLAYAERYLGELGLSPVEQRILEDLRDQVLARLNQQRTDGQADEDDVTEARIGSVETTLRTMDDRLTRIVEQIHKLDSRLQRLEDRQERTEQDTTAVRTDIAQIRQDQQALRTSLPQPAPAIYSRVYLAGGAVAMTVVIALLVILTLRML